MTSRCQWLLVVLLLAGCGSRLPNGTEHDVQGEISSMVIEKNLVTIEHGDIPDGLRAGETEFFVEDPQVFKKVRQGDQVTGHFKVQSGKYILTRLGRIPSEREQFPDNPER